MASSQPLTQDKKLESITPHTCACCHIPILADFDDYLQLNLSWLATRSLSWNPPHTHTHTHTHNWEFFLVLFSLLLLFVSEYHCHGPVSTPLPSPFSAYACTTWGTFNALNKEQSNIPLILASYITFDN